MYTLLIVLSVIAAILLVAVVLIQKSKGGGLSSAFAGGNQVLGVRSTNSFIEKATWTLAIIIVVLSVLSSFVNPIAKETEIQAYYPEQQQAAQQAPAQQAPAAPATPAK